jgi:hypothetical protein
MLPAGEGFTMGKLIERAKAILVTPRTEWPVIAAEPETTAGLYKNYIAILAAIGPIAAFLGTMLFMTALGFAFSAGFVAMLVTYLLTLGAVYVFALIINVLAPTFGGQKDQLQALKTAAYAMTPGFVAGVGQLMPFLGTLVMLAGFVYSIYLLYLGLPHTMKAPAEKAGGYTAVIVIVELVLTWICALLIFGIMGRGMWGGPAVTIGGRDVVKDGNVAALEEWARQMEAAGKQVEASAQQNQGAPSAAAIGALVGAAVGGNTAVAALSTDQLKAYLPETLGGLPRTGLSAERNAAMGFEVSEANADYGDGAGRNLRLEINDTGGVQGLIALAAWANAESERQWDGGYERNYRADDRMVHERWDSNGNSGEYSVIVGNRFAVKVAGQAASMDELKAALASGVNVAGLEATAAAQAKPPG